MIKLKARAPSLSGWGSPRMSKGPFKCPYCESVFKTEAELSKHIDRIHIGSGLLEGDRTKW
ncbi:MAG: C2H2-type zinc finger protein [Candidatus Caldarchaeum sp.]|uniref:C2H2-type zinc finger protein n=1 Tax=Caldiarchaeum subterraneum TaxID=311458 RepID=A0A7J3VTZ7_CALS0